MLCHCQSDHPSPRIHQQGAVIDLSHVQELVMWQLKLPESAYIAAGNTIVQSIYNNYILAA